MSSEFESEPHESKAAKIRRLLASEGDAVGENTREFNRGRYESVARLDDYEELKAEARAIKEDAIERLPELVEEVRSAVEANGGTVYLADDAADANRYVREVCDEKDAERVVKSKSMTTEELDLNDHLGAAGVDVVETDLGEWVLQVADEAPSHLVAPAIHKSREDIADLFEAQFDPDEPLETAEDLTRFAREKLGEEIAGADVGMTGANFVTADSGTLALVTSEGNARKSVLVPDTHVAVAGVEKLIPRVEDLQPFVELIARSGTGQDLTSYLSLFTPPVASPTVEFGKPNVRGFGHGANRSDTAASDGDDTTASAGDDPAGAGSSPSVESPSPTESSASAESSPPPSDDREFHLVLVDNGPTAMREDDQLRETLYCIRCSACANSCANFQSVGGHAFGGETYTGGIATGWEAGVHGLDSAAGFEELCTGCSRCVNACPVGIDIPWINTVVRNRVHRDEDEEFDWLVEGLTPDAESSGFSRQQRFFGNVETAARWGSRLAPLSNWVANARPTRLLLEKALGVDRRRALPTFRRETLVDWFDGRGPRVSDPTREVVLYPDTYTNHVHVERGKAAVRTLEALGVRVRVPGVRESGRAPLSQGMLATAADRARDVAGTLGEHVDAGRDVVVLEPSDLAVFAREYEKFLPSDDYARLRGNSYEVLEYVFGLLENGADGDALQWGDGHPVAYHAHCQQRTLGLDAHTVTVLERRGFDVRTSDVECCGMAGSFGYKRAYYDLSRDVGGRLREQFTTDETRHRTVAASGTSCCEQLDSMLDRSAVHPVELLAPR